MALNHWRYNTMHRFHHSLALLLQLLLLLLLLLLLPVLLTQGCVEEERQALLDLKRGLIDPYNSLESWNSSSTPDCCSGWIGIGCADEASIGGGGGHVIIQLDLYQLGLSGKISPSLHSLKHLEDLILTGNDFQGTPIPPYIGNFSDLTTLTLRDAGFGGAIPPQLGMLQNLYDLDLSGNDFQGNLIPPFIGSLQNLTSLALEDAGFAGPIPPQLGMLRDLRSLAISGGLLYVEDFRWISNLSSLETLEFRNVDMGRASDWESSLSRCPLLQELTLDSCNLTSLHQSSGNGYASLTGLDLSRNHKLGKSFIFTWISSLKNLVQLGLEECSLDGVVRQHHFGSNLTSLQTLRMSNNPLLHIQINPDWVPPFNLSYLDLSSCQVGPEFPLWLRTQNNLEHLVLISARLRDSLPTWIWDFSPSLDTLVISQNQLYGVVPHFHHRLSSVDLSSNNFRGELPAHNVEYLNLSHNSFSGSLSPLLCHNAHNSALENLDLENNLLSGNMSDCWGGCTSLTFVRISNNNLTGPFSDSFLNLTELLSLHLRNNSLSGTLAFLEKHNWENLTTLDLGMNKFNGDMKGTSWEKFSKLRMLMLDSNEISGIIPKEICSLENLQLLVLANNNLSETIPTCFENFRGMKVKRKESYIAVGGKWYNNDELPVFLKGRLDDYHDSLGLLALLDISNNHLSGEIPKELMNLTWLYSLNLSRNQLTGPIPMNIGDMRSLNSLDLSMNRLSGEIPHTISQLTSLAHLNVSHNNLIGRIPSSPQLQTFNSFSYIGNTLCGEPLSKKCDQENGSTPTGNEHDGYKGEGDDSLIGFYVAFPIGFGAGTSAMIITLLFRSSWRIAYFRFIEKLLNKLF